jgi:hypothetical protein
VPLASGDQRPGRAIVLIALAVALGLDVRVNRIGNPLVSATGLMQASIRRSDGLIGSAKLTPGCGPSFRLSGSRRQPLSAPENVEIVQDPQYAAKKARIEQLYAIADREAAVGGR